MQIDIPIHTHTILAKFTHTHTDLNEIKTRLEEVGSLKLIQRQDKQNYIN